MSAVLIGGWKLLFLHGGPFVPDPSRSAQWNRGAYLVNGPGHCAECHSPRNMLGAIIEQRALCRRPDAGRQRLGAEHHAGRSCSMATTNWSEKDIASFLGDGMTPSGDFAGSTMAEVIRNTSLLGADGPRRDRRLHFHAAAGARPDAAAEEEALNS